MSARCGVHTLATLALVASIPAVAHANPVLFRRPEGDGVVFDAEVMVLVAVSVLVEALVLAWVLRDHVARARRFAATVAGAHVLSYPMTLGAADLMVSRFGQSRAVAAEAVAVGVEFVVYLIAFDRARATTPLAPGWSRVRLLGGTIAANALTWMLGLVYLGVRVGGLTR
jgi:hypothetical protein